MRLSKLNEAMAQEYAPILTEPLKHGENGVFFWFPGSGMTTIVRDVFNTKSILRNNLGALADRLTILEFWGHTADDKTALGLLKSCGVASLTTLKSICEVNITKGIEVVLIIGRIDDYSLKDRVTILKMFMQLTALNTRRIHVIFNTGNKAEFEDVLSANPELIILANKIHLLPILSGTLLEYYINEKGSEYGYKLTPNEIQKITKAYGGILQLTKEYLRSHGDQYTLKLKFNVIWNNLSAIYKEAMCAYLAKSPNKIIKRQVEDLKKYGVLNLDVFSQFQADLAEDSEKFLLDILTDNEAKLYSYLEDNSGKFIDKETIINILRPQSGDNVSFWAIDQAVSRFRKKLARAGVDPELFKTIKGKGYKWEK